MEITWRKEHGIKLTVAVDEETRQHLLDLARRLYTESGGAIGVNEDGVERDVPPEESIETIGDALIEIIGSHPILEEAGVEVQSTCCTTDETDSTEIGTNDSARETTDHLGPLNHEAFVDGASSGSAVRAHSRVNV